jgi:hypothetical protein
VTKYCRQPEQHRHDRHSQEHPTKAELESWSRRILNLWHGGATD